jgi:hypothetical protein
MKKILLLLIGLTIISCGSDDADELGNATDPIIGTWLEDDDTNPSTLVFNSNGSYAESADDFSATGTWENNGNNFDLLNQSYTVEVEGDTITVSVLYSGDFSSYTFSNDSDVYTYRKQ